MISFHFHHLGAFFWVELSRFPPCSTSFESGILDSKLENVGPNAFKFVMRRSICVKYDTAPLTCAHCTSDIPGLLLALLVICGWLEAVFRLSLVVLFPICCCFLLAFVGMHQLLPTPKQACICIDAYDF